MRSHNCRYQFSRTGPDSSHRPKCCVLDIIDACGAAWNALLAEPGRIRSLCALGWATVSS
jgi:hypothetical protein